MLKSLRIALCFAVCNFAMVQNSALISPSIFENYKRGATQFVAVIDYLLAGVDTTKPVEWAQQLKKDVQSMPVHFQASLNESEMEKEKLDQSIVAFVAKSGETEAQLTQIQSAVSANQVHVSNCEKQVKMASQHVQNAEQSLASTERALRDLEEQARRAKEDCFMRRRRVKRCWPQWLCSAICEVLNWFTDSINRANGRRNDARGVRDNAINVLNQRRGDFNAAQLKLSSSQRELAKKHAELSSTNEQLKTLRVQIAAVSAVNQGLKSVIVHVDRILTGSSVLKQFVDDLSLIDLNTLIEPLEHIGHELTSQIPEAEPVQIPTLSQGQITAIQNSLKALSEILPSENIITNDVAKAF